MCILLSITEPVYIFDAVGIAIFNENENNSKNI